MHDTPQPMRRNFGFRRSASGKEQITAADRQGVRGDIRLQFDAARPVNQDPEIDRPAFMIRHIQYVGASEGTTPAEAMTPKAHALYEYLLASARTDIADRTEWMVSFADARAYLDVPRSDRISGYIDDISSTWVSYDYEGTDGWQHRGRRMQLLQCSEATSPTGERFIRYSMHPGLRELVLTSVQYTWLELSAFPKFRCRYTARLYPIFALRAGMSSKYTDPLTFNPEELARKIGWPSVGPDFHFGHFEARCLKPALADISDYVKRFCVEYKKPVRAATRGRPVSAIIFDVSPKVIADAELPKADATARDRAIIRREAERRGIDPDHEIPGDDTLRRAATKLKQPVTAVAALWSMALLRARNFPEARLGAQGWCTGEQMLDAFEAHGVGRAFGLWLADYEEPDGLFRADGSAIEVESEEYA